MENHNRRSITILPYLLIALFAIIILLPQLISKTFISGTDSLFHMNRFYETMMQIKTGHYSYFQSIFGFHQSGRIINALYGPIFAYINGLLLMMVKSWFRFQIINSFLALFLSGIFMYILAMYNHVKRQYSIAISFMYMLSYPLMTWVVNQEFTGWGAALLPLLILVGTQILREHKIRTLRLALAVTLLIQTHIMSTLIGCITILPFVIVGWIYSNHKLSMFKHAIGSVIITLLLSGNIWGSMLELFHSNYLMPVFPQINLKLNAVGIQNFSLTFVGNIYTLIFLIVLIGLIIKWKQVNYVYRTISIVGFGFLLLSSQLFPWNALANWNLHFADVIQFPKRFLVVVFILLLLNLGMLLSLPKHGMHIKTSNKSMMIKGALVCLLILIPLLQDYQLFNSQIQNFKSNVVVNQPVDKIHYHTNNPQELRNSFDAPNPEHSIALLTKATPDYLPIKKPIISLNQYYNLHPYKLANQEFIKYSYKYQKQITRNKQIILKWKGNYRHIITIPIVKYANSKIILNGKTLKHVKTSQLGAVQVMSNKGNNQLILQYQTGFLWKLIIFITIISWIGLIVILIL